MSEATRVHLPTIDVIRGELAAVRAELRDLSSPHREVTGAIDVAEIVLSLVDARIAELAIPPCAACDAKKGAA